MTSRTQSVVRFAKVLLAGTAVLALAATQTQPPSNSEAASILGGPRNHHRVTCYKRSPTVRGGSGDDFLLGTNSNDIIWGGGGSDVIFAGPGDDRICGGRGNDRLYGGDGFDRTNGGSGTDVCDSDRRKKCET